MKQFILIFCLAISACVTAQNYNAAWHNYADITSNMVSVNSKFFYMESSKYDSLNLVCIANSGQIVFKKKLNIPFTSQQLAIKVLKTLDNKILSMGRGITLCDAPSYSTVITKSDTNGVTIFQILIPDNQDFIADLTQHPDSSYYLSTGSNKVLHYSKSGVYTSSFTVSYSSVNSIMALQNGNLLLNGTDAGNKNKIITTTGATVYSLTTNYTISAFEESSSGKIYALTNNGSIQTYSSNLTPLNNSLGSQGQNVGLTTFKIRNDSVFCAGVLYPFLMPQYIIFSSSLTVLYQNPSQYKGITPKGISVNNQNRLSIISAGISNANSQLPFHCLYQTSITGSLSSKYDIGVTGITTISATAQNIGWGGYRAEVSLNVDVTNFGIDTVKSFYLNHYYSEICSYSLHKKYYVNVPPNATVTVATGNFYANTNISPNYTSGIFTHTYCVNTTVPGFENDINFDNDSWCAAVPVSIPVGLNELHKKQTGFALFPNPVNDQLMIRSDQKIDKVEIVCADGRMIWSQSSATCGNVD